MLFSFYRPLCGGRSRSHFVTKSLTHSLSQSVSKTQMSHLDTSNADSAHSKDVWNENLELLMSSAVCLLSADCLLGQILFCAAGHLEIFPSCLLSLCWSNAELSAKEERSKRFTPRAYVFCLKMVADVKRYLEPKVTLYFPICARGQ